MNKGSDLSEAQSDHWNVDYFICTSIVLLWRIISCIHRFRIAVLHVQREVNNMTISLQLSSRTAILLVMYHGKFPESAGTSCTRVAARWLVATNLQLWRLHI